MKANVYSRENNKLVTSYENVYDIRTVFHENGEITYAIRYERDEILELVYFNDKNVVIETLNWFK